MIRSFMATCLASLSVFQFPFQFTIYMSKYVENLVFLWILASCSLWMTIIDVIWSSTIHLKSARADSRGVPVAISGLRGNWIFD